MQRLVTLTTVRLEPEAQILKACLEARGIRCTLSGERAANVVSDHDTLNTSWTNPLGGIEVQVAVSDLEAAREFLRSVVTPPEPRKERVPLAEWIAQIERALRAVPLPLRIVLILFGSVWLAGTLGIFLAGLLKHFS